MHCSVVARDTAQPEWEACNAGTRLGGCTNPRTKPHSASQWAYVARSGKAQDMRLLVGWPRTRAAAAKGWSRQHRVPIDGLEGPSWLVVYRSAPVAEFGYPTLHNLEVQLLEPLADGPDAAITHRAVVNLNSRRDLSARAHKENLIGHV